MQRRCFVVLLAAVHGAAAADEAAPAVDDATARRLEQISHEEQLIRVLSLSCTRACISLFSRSLAPRQEHEEEHQALLSTVMKSSAGMSEEMQSKARSFPDSRSNPERA